MSNTTLEIYEANDVDITVTVQDAAGDAVDITGYTFWFTVKDQESDADVDALIQKTITSHTTPSSGITTVSLTNSDTDQDVGEYNYDIQMKDTSSKIQTLVKGNIKIKPKITQTIA